MGVTGTAIAEFFATDAAIEAGADIVGAGLLDTGSLTAADMALTAGVDGAGALTAATAGASAADVAAMQGLGATGSELLGSIGGSGLTGAQMLTGAQTGLAGANLVSTLLKPMPSLTPPSAPGALPQSAHSPNAATISAGLAGAGQAGGSPGAAQTLLTGANGVDPNSLKLGKNTLLGA